MCHHLCGPVSVAGATAMAAAPVGSGHGAPGRSFLGRQVARHLLDHGFSVRIAARHPERARSLLAPDRADAEAVRADVHDEVSVAAALADAFGTVNAISLYVE